MKPPLSYYGGKQRMSKNIIPLLPRHTVYVEPFCGGAAVMFMKPFPKVENNHHYREVINDTDGRIVQFYRVLRDPIKAKELVRRLKLTPYARSEHAKALAIIKGREQAIDDVEQAWAYYIAGQWSFSNQLCGGYRTGVYSRNHSATNRNKMQELRQYIDRMLGVYVENTDAIECIKKWDSPQTLFYCDPPYPGASQGHYSGYTTEDYAKLVEALNGCAGSFVLSNYAQDIEPEGAERFEFQSQASSNSNGKVGKSGADRGAGSSLKEQNTRIEVVWRRFNRVPVRPEIQKLYDSGAYNCYAFPASK